MTGINDIHNALSDRFNEPFSAFLYGLLINMFCSNYPACPTKDLYEANQQSKSVLGLISSLEERVRMAKARRSQLQEQVMQKTQEVRALQSTRTVPTQRKAPQSLPVRSQFTRPGLPVRPRKVTVARDDTFSTNDSFIDIPLGGNGRSTIGSEADRGRGPNLNQAPRYMRGLFESKNDNMRNRVRKPEPKPSRQGTAAARAERARRERMSARPPFR